MHRDVFGMLYYGDCDYRCFNRFAALFVIVYFCVCVRVVFVYLCAPARVCLSLSVPHHIQESEM